MPSVKSIVVSVVAVASGSAPAIDPAIVETVNSNPQATWHAGFQARFANKTLEEAKRLLGAQRATQEDRDRRTYVATLDVAVPGDYDIRTKYGSCSSVQAIYDQGQCGGCWAFAVAESLGDRFCIAGKDVSLSAQDLLNCDYAGHCSGCNGGLTEDAFDYINDNGMLSEPCVPWTGGDSTCTDDSCSASGADSTRYYSSWAEYVSINETKIMQELYTKGSITASFEVFEDFFSYTGGVYKHVTGDYAGLHAVNLMGWGTDGTTGADYWLVKNSWGPSFGESGFFRIARGLDVNGCNFEGGLTSATATLSSVVV